MIEHSVKYIRYSLNISVAASGSHAHSRDGHAVQIRAAEQVRVEPNPQEEPISEGHPAQGSHRTDERLVIQTPWGEWNY